MENSDSTLPAACFVKLEGMLVRNDEGEFDSVHQVVRTRVNGKMEPL